MHLADLIAGALAGVGCVKPDVDPEPPTVPLSELMRRALASSDPEAWSFSVRGWTLEVYESGRCCVLNPDGLDVLAAWRLQVAVELLAAKAGIA